MVDDAEHERASASEQPEPRAEDEGILDPGAGPLPNRAPVQRASIRRNVAHLMSSQVVTWIAATVLSILIPRYLGPATNGQLRLATSLWMIVGIFTALGTDRFLQLQIARSQDRGLRLVGPAIVVRLIAFLVGVATLLGYVALVDVGRVVVILLMIIAVPQAISQVTETLSSAFNGLERMSVPASGLVIGRVSGAALNLVVILAGGSVYLIAGTATFAWGAACAFVVLQYRKVASLTFEGWSDDARFLLRGSLPFLAATVALVLYQQIDVIAISWLATDTDLGYYATADTFLGSLLFPSTVLMATVFPILGRHHQDDPAALEALVRRTFSVLMVVAVPIGLGTMLVGESMAVTIWGSEYAGTGTVLVVLGPVAILMYQTVMFGTVALATGRNRLWVTVILISAALTVPLDLALVPWASERYDNGAIGGAVAYIATESLQFTIGAITICPYLWTRRLLFRTARAFAAGGVMVVVGWWFRDGFLLITVAVCAPVYVGAVLLLRVLDEDQMEMIQGLLHRVRGRLPRPRST